MRREAHAGEAPARRDTPDRDRVRASVFRLAHVARSDDLLAPAQDERRLTAPAPTPPSSVRLLELVTTLKVSGATHQRRLAQYGNRGNRIWLRRSPAGWSVGRGQPDPDSGPCGPIEADEATPRQGVSDARQGRVGRRGILEGTAGRSHRPSRDSRLCPVVATGAKIGRDQRPFRRARGSCRRPPFAGSGE
jgi:hypothetical protein